jgi:hypothetical protein
MRIRFAVSTIALAVAIAGSAAAQTQAPQQDQGSQPAQLNQGSQPAQLNQGSQPAQLNQGSQPAQLNQGGQPAQDQGSQPGMKERAEQQGGAPEEKRALGAPDSPPQHQVIGPPNAGPVAARGEGMDIPGASQETVPAKLSQENAAKDDHWWLDRGQDLTAEQKKAIYAQLARDGAQAGPGTQIFAEPSAEIPLGTKLYEMPQPLLAEMPHLQKFKYVVDQNKVVLVDPVNGTVAAVIAQ